MKYIGIDPPMDEDKRAEVEAGEFSMGIRAWEEDPYGAGKVLVEKRRLRGWTVERERVFCAEVMNVREVTEKEDVMSFLECLRPQDDGKVIIPGPLPWS
jgi:hypothetical protein